MSFRPGAASGLSVLVWLAVTGCGQPPESSAVKVPPTEVTVAKPLQRDVAEYVDFTGRTEAVDSVEIRARVTGYLDKVLFEEGSEVEKNAPLFEIDARPYKAEYDQAVAQQGVRQANLEYQTADKNRNAPLVQKGAVSQAELDKIVASEKEAAASVEAAKASVESASLNLNFTKLAAPIAGRTSRTLITRGNLVTADTTALTTLVSQDPMYAYFDMDERTVLRLMNMTRQGLLPTQDDAPDWPISMGVATDTGFPQQGVIDFVDNQVNTSTGTVKIRGKFPNPKTEHGVRVLAPGLFVRVRVPIGKPHPALLVAERAIATDQGQKYLLVVNAKNEVEYRPVRLGKLDDSLRVIEEGVQATDQVIVIGLQRTRPGAMVAPQVVDMSSFSLESRSAAASKAATAPPGEKSTSDTTPGPAAESR